MDFPRWTSFKSFAFQRPREVAAFNHENLQAPERRRSAYFAGNGAARLTGIAQKA